jgi:hypothetical protein
VLCTVRQTRSRHIALRSPATLGRCSLLTRCAHALQANASGRRATEIICYGCTEGDGLCPGAGFLLRPNRLHHPSFEASCQQERRHLATALRVQTRVARQPCSAKALGQRGQGSRSCATRICNDRSLMLRSCVANSVSGSPQTGVPDRQPEPTAEPRRTASHAWHCLLPRVASR